MVLSRTKVGWKINFFALLLSMLFKRRFPFSSKTLIKLFFSNPSIPLVMERLDRLVRERKKRVGNPGPFLSPLRVAKISVAIGLADNNQKCHNFSKG